LAEKGMDDADTWSSITINGGSVQHLEFLSQDEKDVFKTAFELDQRWVVEHAGDRSEHIDQSQSVNVFLPADVHKRALHQLHFLAWKRGVKSLYYCRSLSIQRAEKREEAPLVAANVEVAKLPLRQLDDLPLAAAAADGKPVAINPAETNDYDECIACQ
ncbi:MAG: hypothetical protein ACFB0Z_07360, partial [Candidatus Phaeomarinobacter sp.]